MRSRAVAVLVRHGDLGSGGVGRLQDGVGFVEAGGDGLFDVDTPGAGLDDVEEPAPVVLEVVRAYRDQVGRLGSEHVAVVVVLPGVPNLGRALGAGFGHGIGQSRQLDVGQFVERLVNGVTVGAFERGIGNGGGRGKST